jgi:hypothetical protein
MVNYMFPPAEPAPQAGAGGAGAGTIGPLVAPAAAQPPSDPEPGQQNPFPVEYVPPEPVHLPNYTDGLQRIGEGLGFGDHAPLDTEITEWPWGGSTELPLTQRPSTPAEGVEYPQERPGPVDPGTFGYEPPAPYEPWTELEMPMTTTIAPEMGNRNFDPEDMRRRARELYEELVQRSRRTGESLDKLLQDAFDRLNHEDPLFAIMFRAQLAYLQINAPARGGAISEPISGVGTPLEQLNDKMTDLGRGGDPSTLRERVQALIEDIKDGRYPMSHPEANRKAVDILRRAAQENLSLDGLREAFNGLLFPLAHDLFVNAREFEEFSPIGQPTEIGDGVQLTLNEDGTYTIEMNADDRGSGLAEDVLYYREPGSADGSWKRLNAGESATVTSGTLLQIGPRPQYLHVIGDTNDFDAHINLIDPTRWGADVASGNPELIKAQFVDRLEQILDLELFTPEQKAEQAAELYREMVERGFSDTDGKLMTQIMYRVGAHFEQDSDGDDPSAAGPADWFMQVFRRRIFGGESGGPDSKSLGGAGGKDDLGPNGEGGDSIAALARLRGMTWKQASQVMDVASIIAGHLGQEDLARTLRIGVAGGNFYQNQSFDTAFALASAFAASGLFGDDAARFAGYANTGMSVGRMVTSFSGSTALAGIGALSQFVPMGMNERRFLNTGLAAASFALAPNPVTLAMLFSSIITNWGQGEPTYRDLGQIDANGDGIMEDLFYRNPANGRSGEYEYRFAGIESGPPIAGFVGELLEMNGQFFLGGGFTTEQLNQFTGAGLATLDNSIVIGDRAILRRGADGPGMRIDEATYRHLLALNGGSSQLVLGVGSQMFETVAPFTQELQSGAIFRQNAHHGIHSMIDVGGEMMGVRSFPEGFEGARDSIFASYANPFFAGEYEFRDTQTAVLFSQLWMPAMAFAASDPHVARWMGFNPQGALDYLLLDPERQMPADMFNIYAYLAANPDVEQAVGANMMQGFEHYFTYGVHEGRPIHASEEARLRSAARATGLAAFDEATYLALHPDVAAAVARGETTARAHYETFGFNEQRMPFFDDQGYLAANPDVAAHVAAGGGSALDHWVQFGQNEGRPLAPAAVAVPEAAPGGFDERAYLAANPDVAAAIANGTIDSGLGHFQRHGADEGRQFFDEQGYLAQHQGVAEAVANGTMDSALGHWERHGQHEGFGIAVSQDAPIAPVAAPAPAPAPTFEEAYFAANPDVAASGMSAADHYHSVGAEEGRTW